ncbi:MAG: radical SAM protein [Phycisphaerae bacterium]|nr:radical SAM protein [Phycisphaerae bacterium]NIP55424.1 radical SAM protein [Phycisphaerae bacterium]NIS54095.1 radical SAM protein [Phycisphaerae bacterium]NIU11737.1 radical SAM protein [Phycisphaerae bacterium]NIU59551.1 radical SAM protein [Phycisphaerae bacterium]
MQKTASWVAIWPPIALASLASIAKKKGPVRLLDGNVETITMEDLLKDIKEFAPDLIVINTGFPSIDVDMAAAKEIKNTFPKTKVLAFGVYFTLLEQQGLVDYPFLDFAIIGEPEDTFDEILSVLDDKTPDYGTIRGLAYKEDSGFQVTTKRTLIGDLDKIPFPDRGLLKKDRYKLPHNNKTFTLINSARGCPYPCIYCIVGPYYGKKLRSHSIDYVIDEIKECVNKYGIHEILFWEEIFTLDKDRVLSLCDAISKHNLSISWAATTRVDRLDEEIVSAMKNAGCYLLGLGIESGVQSILDNSKKKQNTADIKRAVKLCKKAGLKTMGHFIFGLPGETRETANQTIKFMSKLGLNYMQCYCAVPYPKTELGNLAKKNNWVRAEKWSQYDFGGESILHTDTMRPEDVSYFRRKAFRRFYFNPLFILRTLKETKIKRIFSLFKFAKWMNPKN